MPFPIAVRTLLFSIPFLREQDDQKNDRGSDGDRPSDLVLAEVVHKSKEIPMALVVQIDLHDAHFLFTIVTTTAPKTATARSNNSIGPGVQAIIVENVSDDEPVFRAIDTEGSYLTFDPEACRQRRHDT